MAKNNTTKQSKRDTFWHTDINEIESELIGEDILKFPVFMDDRVPSQGSVLLPRAKVVNNSEKKSSGSWLSKIFGR